MNDYMEALRVQLMYLQRRETSGTVAWSRIKPDEYAAMDRAVDVLLAHGQTVFVAPWVEQALWDAADSVPAEVVCTADALPSHAGFVLLRGTQQINLSGELRGSIGGLERARIDAIGWVQIEGQTNHRYLTMVVPWLSAPNDPPHWGHWSTLTGFPIQGSGIDGVLVPPDATEDVAQLRRFLYALWAFMAEKRVTTVTRRSVDRPLRKQAERNGWTHEPIVQVVELRASESRPRSHEGAPESVEWACRWAVRGHWRKQFYPGTGTHSAKWIPAYVKGPSGLPLRHASKLFAVVR